MSWTKLRLKRLIERRGDAFTVGGNGRRGIFSPLDHRRAATYLTASEIAAAALPMWLALVAHDDATAISNTVSWNGLSLTVKRVVDLRHRGASIGRVLVLV